MRILFSINSMNCGGAERVISILANRFAREGHDTEIVVQDFPKSFYELDSRVKYVSIPKSEGGGNVMLYRIKMLRKEIVAFAPDIVVSFIADYNIVTALACRGLNTHLIVSERNDPAKRPTKRLMRILRNIVYNMADGYVFQTPDAKAYFNKKIQKKSTVIVNPFDTKSMPPVADGERNSHIAVVNRLVPQKRVDNIIRAFSRLPSQYSQYELDILGDGPQMDSLRELCRELSVSERVHFHGRVDNVLETVREMELFVLASDFEGMPNTLIEAMCMGLACVSTDCPVGGPRMLIEHKSNGYLIETNSEDAIYNALCELMSDKSLVKRMATEASKLRERVEIDVVFEEWLKYIQAVRKTEK